MTEQIYECKRCHYQCKTKGNLLSHLKRIKPCDTIYDNTSCENLQLELTKNNISTYFCNFCDKEFNYKSNKLRHEKTCKDRNKSTTQEIEELKSQVLELQKIIKDNTALTKANNTQNINTQNIDTQNNTTNNTTNNIQINCIGQENMSHFLGSESFRNVMMHLLKNRETGVCNLLMKKHFDPEHPENNNIKKMNKKDSFIEVYNGRNWELKFSDEVLQEVFGHLQNDFYDFIDDELCSEDGKIRPNWVKNFIELVGIPLEWDHSAIDNMDNIKIDQLSEDKKSNIKKRIYMLALEYIYRKSKEIHS